MGGYVALALARQQPDLIHSVMTLGTKFFWDEATAAREAARLDPAVVETKVPQFARELEARHTASGWQTVVSETAAMLRDLGAHPLLSAEFLAEIQQPVRVVVGDRDATVSVEETTAAWRALPKGQLQVLPATPHPLERVSVALLAESIRAFMASGPA
jgi:pimeloyl-ACP methyl ester carboxylesterase